MDMKTLDEAHRTAFLDALGRRSIVLVGIMGAGKTAIGRKLAQLVGLPFVDSDLEIERVSRMGIPELFERYGEPEFRALERRVIGRILEDGPQVLSIGGGAFMSEETRDAIGAAGISVWLRAELDVLMERVAKKQNRPLLKTANPRETMRQLMDSRYPVYARANLTVQTRDEKRDVITGEVFDALASLLGLAAMEETR
jgi:shikimate kinase